MPVVMYAPLGTVQVGVLDPADESQVVIVDGITQESGECSVSEALALVLRAQGFTFHPQT